MGETVDEPLFEEAIEVDIKKPSEDETDMVSDTITVDFEKPQEVSKITEDVEVIVTEETKDLVTEKLKEDITEDHIDTVMVTEQPEDDEKEEIQEVVPMFEESLELDINK